MAAMVALGSTGPRTVLWSRLRHGRRQLNGRSPPSGASEVKLGFAPDDVDLLESHDGDLPTFARWKQAIGQRLPDAVEEWLASGDCPAIEDGDEVANDSDPGRPPLCARSGGLYSRPGRSNASVSASLTSGKGISLSRNDRSRTPSRLTGTRSAPVSMTPVLRAFVSTMTCSMAYQLSPGFRR